MIVAVLANEDLKKEWLAKGVGGAVELIWADSVRALTMTEADAYFDLLFEPDNERSERLKQLLPKPVFVNAVAYTTKTIGYDFIRINAWPTFLQRNLAEIALPSSVPEKTIAEIFQQLNWQYRIVPDIIGMITARIVAMIINEAFYTWGAAVSSKEEIDIAMKLGTNYPLGPFEWSEKIGLHAIYELLKELGRTDERYTMAPALISTIMNKLVILSIDTATEAASVALSVDGVAVGIRSSSEQKDHASWVQVAIQEMVHATGYHMRDINAVAVSAGPGSYTGLRVGMATAKGICYALNIPLITENTLKIMAFAVKEENGSNAGPALLCPMIDARRMEVFTAVYDNNLQEVLKPTACVLDDSTFKEALNNATVIFFGNGSAKWKHLCNHTNARFIETNISLSSYLGKMATSLYLERKFADLAYENPVYLKEFYSYTKK